MSLTVFNPAIGESLVERSLVVALIHRVMEYLVKGKKRPYTLTALFTSTRKGKTVTRNKKNAWKMSGYG